MILVRTGEWVSVAIHSPWTDDHLVEGFFCGLAEEDGEVQLVLGHADDDRFTFPLAKVMSIRAKEIA